MTSLPLWALAAISIGVAVVVALAGVMIVRRLIHRQIREGHNDVLVPIFLTAGTLYAVLLAFLVILVWEQYGSAKTNVNEESSVLATMYRQTDGMAADQQKRVRADLREYANAVIEDEFNQNAEGQGDISDNARKALADMYAEFGSLPADQAANPVNGELVRNLSTLSIDRSKRLIQSSEQVPALLWFGMLAGAVLVIGMTWLLFMERRWPHVVMSAALAALISMLLFISFVLDKPFTGQQKLKPDAFEHALSVFDSVDGGN